MNQGMDLSARLEGGVETVTLPSGTVISYRHPTQAQISAAMASAGVEVALLDEANEDQKVTTDLLDQIPRLERAKELIGAYCLIDMDPRPALPAGAAWRERGSHRLRRLSEAAQEKLDPMLTTLGEYLLDKSNASDEEGKP